MNKIRVLIFFITLAIVGFASYFASLYARGYRFNWQTKKFLPSGLLIVKSNPEGALLYIDGELKGATNLNLSLSPGNYDLTIRKEGYYNWSKRIIVEKEIVTETNTNLFKIAPSLSAMTLSESTKPHPSNDFTKIAYIVPSTVENTQADKEGLWILETVDLPLGFAKDPRRITNGDLANVSIQWSPDDRQILLKTKQGSYLLDASVYTAQAQRVNISTKEDLLLKEWQSEKDKKFESQLRGLPERLIDILRNKTDIAIFSPDETKVIYLVSSDDSLPDELIKPIPGASTQKQERNLKVGQVYVYDIKEDRNFAIDIKSEDTKNCNLGISVIQLSCSSTLSWFSTSAHLVNAKDGKIIIMDYDGTNRQEVYNGSYVAPFAFPVVSDDRLIILTNLGASSDSFNLYSLSIK